MKHACYVKIKLLDIEPIRPSVVASNEIRWFIDESFEDTIQISNSGV